jgi:hypothetical protein
LCTILLTIFLGDNPPSVDPLSLSPNEPFTTPSTPILLDTPRDPSHTESLTSRNKLVSPTFPELLKSVSTEDVPSTPNVITAIAIPRAKRTNQSNYATPSSPSQAYTTGTSRKAVSQSTVTQTRANANSNTRTSHASTSYIVTSSSKTTHSSKSTNTNANTTTTPRTLYKLPLTEEQKNLINNGTPGAFLPESEDTDFDPQNVFLACGSKECKSALEEWWSTLESAQLFTARDFREDGKGPKICSRCLGAKSVPKLLQSMSQKQAVKVKEKKYNKVVDLYEICKMHK